MTRTDDFNRSDGELTGGNWTKALAAVDQDLVISGNAVTGEGGFLNGDYWSADAFNGNHESQITKADANDYTATGVRMSNTSSGQGYAYFNHGSVQKVVGGANTEIATTSSFTSGQIARLRAVDDLLSWWVNGALVDTLTDATHAAGGAPGAYVYGSVAKFDDWIGNDNFNTTAPPYGAVKTSRPAPFAPGHGR